jgi:hypothetical protein
VERCRAGARSGIVLVAAITGLAFAPPGLAAKRKREKVDAVSRQWEVKVDEHTYKLKDGGELVYPSCDTIQTITSVVHIKIPRHDQTRSGREYEYKAILVGPKSAGHSVGVIGRFDGLSTTFRAHFTATEFKKLSEILSVNRRQFVVGSYSLELTISGESIKLKVPDTIKLRSKAGC